MTLIELLVGMGLFALLGSILLTLALSTRDVTQDVRDRNGTTEEARTAVERMTRELRQARDIEAVHLPSTGDPSTWIRFWTDFDGDGVRDTSADQPEVMTYRWDPPSGDNEGQLSLSALGGEAGLPLLAVDVTDFHLELQSSSWEYDLAPAVGTGDGVTTWQELDETSPPGNRDGLPDGAELAHIDLVVVSMQVQSDHGTQNYRTQIDLRNGNR
jgi:type II secretory pathway pseudopilin PulG